MYTQPYTKVTVQPPLLATAAFSRESMPMAGSPHLPTSRLETAHAGAVLLGELPWRAQEEQRVRTQGDHAAARNWCGGNSSDASSDDDDTSFSDALERISSPDQRVGSFDRITSKRFEDIFLARATSLVNDQRLAPAEASLATSSSSRGLKHWRRRSTRRDHDGQRPTPPLKSNDHPVQVQLNLPRINIDGRVEQMSPGACGLMVFFPWSAKPAVVGSGARVRSTRLPLSPPPAITLRPPTAAGSPHCATP